MYICIYVYMYICIYVYIYIGMHIVCLCLHRMIMMITATRATRGRLLLDSFLLESFWHVRSQKAEGIVA